MPCQWTVVGAGSLLVTYAAHAIALDRLDRRSVDPAVVAPAKRAEAGSELVIDLLGDEVIDLHAVDDLPRKRGAPGVTVG